MAWKNQGGGPWGSGPKGPWGSGPQPAGPRPPDLEDLLRRAQDRLQQFLPGGYFSGLGIVLALLAVVAIWGVSRLFPRAVRRTRRRAALRQACAHGADPGLSYHLPYPIETVLLPKALRVSTLNIGFTCDDSPRRARDGRRDIPEESLMLTGDENIVDVQFTVLWRIKPKRRRRLSLQHPESRRHREGGGRKRDARSRRPLQHPGDSHQRQGQDPAGGAGPDAEDARRLRFGHSGAAVADG